MLAFTLRRAIQAIGVMIAVGVIAFSMFRFAGDPVNQIVSLDTPAAEREAVRKSLGLDDPVPVQFARYFINAVQFKFGVSYQFRQPVSNLLMERMPATLELAACATFLAMSILEKGGNAFDAGVATAFTLQVVEPHLNGPGGDVPIIVHDTKRGRTEVICGQGPAPAKATIAHYKSEGLEMVPGTGLLAACVPGTFESWMLLLRDYGTMRLRDVLEPAIAYARDGYPLVERASATIQVVEKLFRKHWTTSAAVYLPNNEVPKPGTLFTNKQLSETYARILSEAESAGGDRVAQIERARKSWSQGFVAEAIDKFCRTQEVMPQPAIAPRNCRHRRRT